MGNSYDIWLSSSVSSVARIDALLQMFQTAEAVFYAKEPEIRSVGVLTETDLFFLTSPDKEENRRRQYDYIEKHDIRMICRGEKDYPARFSCLSDAPYGIFLEGRLPPPDAPAIAIVGSRSPSVYGTNVAALFAGELAAAGVYVISGLAMGIDGISHINALPHEGRTLGILGSGIGVPYPKENWQLYQSMRENAGILSEYGPEVPPRKQNFPHRNRLISAMADGVLVVEAAERSGTLITVDRGLEQGKEIYVIPGRIGDRNSVGCLNLLRQGARLVTSPEEILDDLAAFNPSLWKNASRFQQLSMNFPNPSDIPDKNSENINLGIAPREKVVYALCRLDAKHFDVLLSESGMGVAELAETLNSLEQKGIIRQVIPNHYSLRV